MFKDGVRYGTNNGQYFVYQALATLEAEMDNEDSARELFEQGIARASSKRVFMASVGSFRAFIVETGNGKHRKLDRHHQARRLRAAAHSFARIVAWFGAPTRDEDSAEVEARLKQLVSEQRYAPVGKEVTVD